MAGKKTLASALAVVTIGVVGYAAHLRREEAAAACYHFSGEIPDPSYGGGGEAYRERSKEVEAGIRENCPGDGWWDRLTMKDPAKFDFREENCKATARLYEQALATSAASAGRTEEQHRRYREQLLESLKRDQCSSSGI